MGCRRMNRILKPCEWVVIDGMEYALNTDFSVWIEIEQLIFCRKHLPEEALAKVLTLAYPVLPENPGEAIGKLLWFYSGGKPSADGKKKSGFQAPPFDLKEDFGYVWAGFLSEFGIDLSRSSLHWWKFLALLSALSEDCRFSRIVSYRSTDTSQIKDGNLRRFYEKMKDKYRLPDLRSEAERELDTVLKLETLF